MSTSPLARALMLMRVCLHTMVAFLLVLGVATADLNVPIIFLAIVFAAMYVLGTWRYRLPCFLVGFACWVALVLLSETFSWLLFPLVFVALHVLGAYGLIAVAIGWVVVALHAPNLGGMIGPAVGALTAVAAYYLYVALHNEREHAAKLEERERISREIHDTLAQGFSSIVLLSRIKDNPEQTLQTIHDVAQENLQEARMLISSLKVSQIEESLEQLVQRAIRQERALGRDTRIECAIDSHPHLDPLLGGVIYRIAQEGLNNALKHAGAQRIQISLATWDDEVALDIRDNGSGITRGPGTGLRGIRSRVNELDGTVEISSDSSGTCLAVHIPLKERS